MALQTARCLMDPDGVVLLAEGADLECPTASIGKVFLLCEAAERITSGRLDPLAPLARDAAPAVADSGLWQHLAQPSLPILDVCVLVAAVSDNWATNSLLEVIGLAAVADRAQALGCSMSRLHDRVRDRRDPADPPTLSSGSVRELAEVARRIHLAAGGHEGLGISPAAARLVEGWLLTGVDLTLVAAPFHLDPLAHVDAVDGSPMLWNKTGWDTGVRAEMGAAWRDGTDSAVFYAAIASWNAGEDPGAAYAFLHETGQRLVDRLVQAVSSHGQKTQK